MQIPVSWDVWGVQIETAPLTSGGSLPRDGREHWFSSDTQLSLTYHVGNRVSALCQKVIQFKVGNQVFAPRSFDLMVEIMCLLLAKGNIRSCKVFCILPLSSNAVEDCREA